MLVAKQVRASFTNFSPGKSHKIYARPMLGYVLVGNNPDSELYVRLKKKACESMGIEYVGSHLKEDISQE